jgi:type IV pilus assembly protein PilA
MWLNLCVVFTISAVGCIALPSFLPGCAHSKQPEAKTYVGAMIRTQQAYYLEKNRFAKDFKDFDELELGIPSETRSNRYMTSEERLAYAVRVPDANSSEIQKIVPVQPIAVISTSLPKDPTLKSYVGIVWTLQKMSANPQESDISTRAILCEAKKPGIAGTGVPLNTPKPIATQGFWLAAQPLIQWLLMSPTPG